MQRLSVLIVDNSASLSKELESVLTEYDPLHARRTVATAEEALEVGKVFRPDVIIYDLPLGGTSDAKTIAKLKNSLVDTRIIVFSLYEHYQAAALSAGASEFVNKTAPRSVLMEALGRQGRAAGYSPTE